VDPDDGMEEEGPYLAWVPPDDRLWRHPSEGPAQEGPNATQADDHGGAGKGGPPSGQSGWAQHPVTRIWMVAIVAGLVGAVVASGVGLITGAFEARTTVVRSVVPTAPTVTLASATSNSVNWTAVDDAIAPSVVEIQVTTASGPATGSGVVFEPGSGETYIVTDSALVSGATGIQVSFVAGQQYHGQVVGTDPLSGLAIVAVAAPTWEQSFPPLGTVATLRLANPVLALGARANAPASIFSGSIAAEDREVELTGGSTMENVIAVSGSSPLPNTAAGGPLIDQQGEVVGITLSLNPTNSTDQGLLFAVPVDVAVHVAQQLLARTSVTHP
jgi:S1-C subfamily serine protease